MIDSESLTPRQQQSYYRQERFLSGYSAGGTRMAGIRALLSEKNPVKSPWKLISWWLTNDFLGFRERLDESQQQYNNHLEDKLQELIDGLKPGQNSLLLIAALNANMPEKYRPNVIVVDEKPKELLDEVKKLVKAQKKDTAPAEEIQPSKAISQAMEIIEGTSNDAEE
jgi:hypothetical protein